MNFTLFLHFFSVTTAESKSARVVPIIFLWGSAGLRGSDASFRTVTLETSRVVQWLSLHPNAGGLGVIPARGTKIPRATQHGQK